MLVRMIGDVSGTRNGEPWPRIGRSLELPADEALSLIHAGLGVPVVDPERGVQTAVLPSAPLEERVSEQRAALVKGKVPEGRSPGSAAKRTTAKPIEK